MMPSYVTPEALNAFVDSALAEDIGAGDHTTRAVIPAAAKGTARLLAKAPGILAGVTMAEWIFHRLDPALQLHKHFQDGQSVKAGDIAFEVRGSIRSILTSERVVLNCMQRMSGIATYTTYLASLLKGTKAQLTDTRKTTPNFRLPEKWAVAIGGGRNHRYALYDQILIKDNHVDIAGGIGPALDAARLYLRQTGEKLLIEIETRNLAEVQQVLDAGGADIVMLDNMSPSQVSAAVVLLAGKCKTEASGGITEDNLRAMAETGVDYISVGALTHSVKSLDLSLKVA